ncbi:DUF4235 domain-containing protein [Fulvivirga sediminis]|uniref:DUF4235 domain-containing protein n=1 Tax=Fulvivirga sediminis TaxID=2803949 RepID=A0A937K0E9_9BACT|nr:DUF4235 domain-containing protein [Fulvivirga sediminis]MBL3655467.1 DUF4235 domain-containing protein [Fulvivirga sediminis]
MSKKNSSTSIVPTDKQSVLSSIVLPGIAIASSFALKKLFDISYQKIRKQDPPKTLHHNDYNTTHIILWTVATSALAGIVKLMANDMMQKKIKS